MMYYKESNMHAIIKFCNHCNENLLFFTVTEHKKLYSIEWRVATLILRFTCNRIIQQAFSGIHVTEITIPILLRRD